MATTRLQIRPGVDTIQTPTDVRDQFVDSNLIRFFEGRATKLGGWGRLSSTPLTGICRGMFGWADFNGNPYLATGSDQKLQVLNGGKLIDITPITHTSNFTPAFAMTAGSPTVTVTDAGYTPSPGDWINLVTAISVGGGVLQGPYQVVSLGVSPTYTVTAAFNAVANDSPGAVPTYTTTTGSSTVSVLLPNHPYQPGDTFTVGASTAVGGLTLSGAYTVQTRVDASHFTITASASASSNATVVENTNRAQVQYLIPSGVAWNTPAGTSGWGAGNWGAGDWGGSQSGPGSSTILPIRCWSFVNWGQDLIANYYDGPIYYSQPPAPSVAQVLPNSPLHSTTIVGIAQAQIIMALGTETGGTQFPTLIRWCDSGDRTDWVASATNQAGSFQIPTGSAIIGALVVGLGVLIWTDVALWMATYNGLPFVFGFKQVAISCELISMRSAIAIGNRIIWPSDRSFFQFNGGSVDPLNCTVWNWMFDNIDDTQKEATFGALNTLFDEVAWHFPVKPSSPIYDPANPMAYVKYNYVDNVWDKGFSSQYQRTAWVDHSPMGNPIGSDGAQLLQQHETSFDADGTAMVWFARTGYGTLQDEGQYWFIRQFIPDFLDDFAPGVTNVTKLISFYGQDFPGHTPKIYGPYPVGTKTPYQNLNIRHRQLALQVGGNDLGTSTRFGALRLLGAPGGRR